MSLFRHNTAFPRVTTLAAQRPVHAAFQWIHNHPKIFFDWQLECVAIPAPPFGEERRSRWFAERFRELGLSDVHTDELGNVVATLPAAALPADASGPIVLLSGHLDTVFPADTPLQPTVDGDRIQAPGVCDNVAGLVGVLAIAQALLQAQYAPPVPLVFLANVGEEGEGDLRGVRHFYQHHSLASRVAAHIVLDGAGCESAITQALGSRRFQITVHGPGGHSFTDAGTPNPIAALAAALVLVAQTELPDDPRTTLNLGTIQGGTSVNSIPQSATAAVDFRSTSPEQLTRLEEVLHEAVQHSVQHWNNRVRPAALRDRGLLSYTIDKIGDRPAAQLAPDSVLFETLRAVDRHLNLRTEPMLGSTDANIPLSLGVPSLSLGAGGSGGGAHTRAEWYSAQNRELGLKRILLLLLATTAWAAEQ